ncbi:golgin subfamily A member 5-like isoform X2 [Anticarsia gemmatalis]|uniref:golgin subfamily A member 5-like isoform X2 n=1 Tax=Anticarsia gemmatalis TaxID=129554 RepID=UPI003F761F4A
MSWFADLAGKAESLLNNLDEQTGAALRNHNVSKKKIDKNELNVGPRTEMVWGPKKRPIPRNSRKSAPVSPEKIPPCQKSSPMSNQSRPHIKDGSENKTVRSRKSPTRKPSPIHNLNHCPKTLVGDVKDSDVSAEHIGLKQRRCSLPSDLELLSFEDDWMYKLQNLEVENAMLKNELNVMNREVAELLDRLRKTEDEAVRTQIKLDTTELLNQRTNIEKSTLATQIDQLKMKLQDLVNSEVPTYKAQNKSLQNELDILRNRNRDLEDKCKELYEKASARDAAQIKIENDLRHAQSTISDLQSNLERSTEECRRLERDWEAYKLRVKNMLHAKDTEIKKMQVGIDFTADTKELMQQIEILKEERDDLSEAVSTVRSECDEMKIYLQQVEARHTAAERVVAALRDALKEERAARNRADVQWATVAKDLKTLQIETGQTIASLRTALRDKDHELNRLRDTSSTVRTTDTSALNVADYDVMQDSIENNKIHYLTQTLVQRQSKIDKLLADNNILRIQLEKLESKYKAEITSVRAGYSHAVVQLAEGECRQRARPAPHSLSALSLRVGVLTKRYPIMRLFIILYMICLHFWVIMVLFTSTPEDYVTRPLKS